MRTRHCAKRTKQSIHYVGARIASVAALLRNDKRWCSQSGFTLIETLLSLAIFTIIGLATAKHIQQLASTKNAALAEMDTYDNLRAAISLMRFDINQAFHVLYDDLGMLGKQEVLANKPVPHTIFDGRKKELVFTSLSHRVYYTNLRECSQSEISYFLQPQQKSALPTLMKRESGFIDADLYQGGQVYSLLENVSLFELQYWDDRIGKWVDDWNSDGGDKRDRFPQAVKMKLAIAQDGKKPFQFETEFRINFTNNVPLLVQF